MGHVHRRAHVHVDINIGEMIYYMQEVHVMFTPIFVLNKLEKNCDNIELVGFT